MGKNNSAGVAAISQAGGLNLVEFGVASDYTAAVDAATRNTYNDAAAEFVDLKIGNSRSNCAVANQAGAQGVMTGTNLATELPLVLGDRVQLQQGDSGFYTTKDDGIGIGLSVSRSIIQNRGRLGPRQTMGPGLTFSYRFPAPANANSHQ